MRNTFLLFAAICFFIAGVFAAASAQDVPGDLDLGAIRARASEHAADAEALARSVRKRADALAEDASATKQGAQQSRASYAETATAGIAQGPLDLDGMIRTQADAEAATIGETPRFIAFASLAMPEPSLKALVRDVTRAGGVTVLRGFPQGDSAAFKARLAAIWRDSSEAGALGIDPRLFRAFGIETAPSFVMVAGDFSPCDGFACTDAPPAKVSSTSATRILPAIRSCGGPGAALARLHLQRLQGERP